jgi:hypothetical protein
MEESESKLILKHLKNNSRNGLLSTFFTFKDVVNRNDKLSDAVEKFDVDLFLRYWNIDESEVAFCNDMTVCEFVEFVSSNRKPSTISLAGIDDCKILKQYVETNGANSAFDLIAAFETTNLGKKNGYRVELERSKLSSMKLAALAITFFVFVSCCFWSPTFWHLGGSILGLVVVLSILTYPHLTGSTVRHLVLYNS